jgi:ubiquitin-conjugating enzyme E2 S
VLKRDWAPTLGLRHVFTVIRCLLIEPNPESALNEEAGKLLLDSFDDFARKARLMTEVHARRPSVLTSNALNAEAPPGEGRPPAGGVKAKGLVGRAGVDKKRSLKRL